MNSNPSVVVMPDRLTADDLDAVKRNPLCEVDNKDELYKRLGWLIFAYDAIVAARIKAADAAPPAPTFERK